MKDLAPDIFRQRLLMEGFYSIGVEKKTIEDYFYGIIRELELRTYGPPIIHETSGIGKEANQGFDAFIPLIDSGIYICVWVNLKFLSIVLYTCKKFDEEKAVGFTKNFFKIKEIEWKGF
ncbi:hypothetical protein HYZ41_03440 [archaeon]|nr:hypothetical protein [archaeon]